MADAGVRNSVAVVSLLLMIIVVWCMVWPHASPRLQLGISANVNSILSVPSSLTNALQNVFIGSNSSYTHKQIVVSQDSVGNLDVKLVDALWKVKPTPAHSSWKNRQNRINNENQNVNNEHSDNGLHSDDTPTTTEGVTVPITTVSETTPLYTEAVTQPITTVSETTPIYTDSVTHSITTEWTPDDVKLVRLRRGVETRPPTCTSSPDVTNAFIDMADEYFLTYSCNNGYTHTSGEDTWDCQAEIWIDAIGAEASQIVCTGNCDDAPSVTAASSTNDGSVATYSCDGGYVQTGGVLTWDCATKSWIGGDVLVCEQPVPCANVPVITNANYDVQPSGDPIMTNAVATYTCTTGYMLMPSNVHSLQCDGSGTWTGTHPVCIGNCEDAPSVTAASSTNDGSVATYSCDGGYVQTGGVLTWDCATNLWIGGSEIVCEQSCDAVPVIANSAYVVQPSGDPIVTGAVATYTCDYGYSLSSSDDSLVCDGSGLWLGTLPECIGNCEDAPSVTAASSTNDGSVATYSCDGDYAQTGGVLTWDCVPKVWIGGDELVCEHTCTSVPVITNSNYVVQPSGDPMVTDAVATYTCVNGYSLVSAQDNNLQCDANGLWVGTYPECTGNCDDAPSVTAASSTNDGSVATYSCDGGYVQTGGVLTWDCSTKFWIGGSEIICEQSCDAVPVIADSTYVVQPSGDPIVTGAVATYTCDYGYSLSSSDDSLVCVGSGQWVGTLPECIGNCEDAPSVTAASSTNDGSVATYSCDGDYAQTGGVLTWDCVPKVWIGGDELVCEHTCTSVPVITNSNYVVQPSDDPIVTDAVATYTCVNGYSLVSAQDNNLQCDANGLWVGTYPECTGNCDDAPSVTAASSTNDGSVATYSCDGGYVQTGGVLTWDCPTKFWIGGSEIICEQSCDAVPVIADSTYAVQPSGDPIVTGAVATYTCDYGYSLSSSDDSLVCDGSGQWVGTFPECIGNCEDVPSVTAASSTNDGSVATYSCDGDYVLTGGVLTWDCVSKYWIGGDPIVCERTCAAVPAITNSAYALQPSGDPIVTGAVATYTCDYGYSLVSAAADTLVCDALGQWIGTFPECSGNCEDAPSVTAASSTNDGSVATYSCDGGYVQTGGVLTWGCPTKLWIGGSALVCEHICGAVPVITNSNYGVQPSGDPMLPDTVATYTCDFGYTLVSGTDNILVCDDTGQWVGTTPECIGTCEDAPSVTAASSTEDGVVATYTCNGGYVQTGGVLTWDCLPKSWNGGTVLVCERNCSSVPVIANSVYAVQPSGDPTVEGAVATYTCNSGYTLMSPSVDSLQCDASGLWVGTVPVCIDVDECSTNNGGCVQICTNTVGSYACSCNEGYNQQGDNDCQDDDECNTNNGGCAHTCTNTGGSYVCSCNDGYNQNGDHDCQDEDECADGTDNCDQTCTNSVGSFSCSCGDGYTQNGDGHTCDDNNECENNNNNNNNGGCEDTCVNEPGGYSCSCPTNTQLNVDGHQCDDIDDDQQDDMESRTQSYEGTAEGAYVDNNSNRATFQTQLTNQYSTIQGFTRIYVSALVYNDTSNTTDVRYDVIYESEEDATMSTQSASITVDITRNVLPIIVGGMQVIFARNKTVILVTDENGTVKKVPVAASSLDDVCYYFIQLSYCRNGGVCSPETGNATCSCRTGFHGTFCEVAIQYLDDTESEILTILLPVLAAVACSLLICSCCFFFFRRVNRGDGESVWSASSPSSDVPSEALAVPRMFFHDRNWRNFDPGPIMEEEDEEDTHHYREPVYRYYVQNPGDDAPKRVGPGPPRSHASAGSHGRSSSSGHSAWIDDAATYGPNFQIGRPTVNNDPNDLFF